MFDELTQVGSAWGNTSTPNPPYGAVFTYNVVQAPAGDAKLWLSITDDAGRAVRRMEVPEGARPPSRGLESPRRAATPSLPENPAAAAAAVPCRLAGATIRSGLRRASVAGASRRGQPVAAGPVSRDARDSRPERTLTAIGQPQAFAVVPLPR